MTTENTKNSPQKLTDKDLSKVRGAGGKISSVSTGGSNEAEDFMSKEKLSVSTGAAATPDDFMSRDKAGK